MGSGNIVGGEAVVLRSAVKQRLQKFGYRVSRYDPRRDPLAVRKLFFESHRINVVYDVGANAGQFALELRESGYRGKLISFEPLSSAFKKLSEAAKNDPNWHVQNCALGSKEATAGINVSKNSWSSSLLDVLPTCVQAAPDSVYIGKEIISIKTLDALFHECCDHDSRVFLKIDTQGFTKQVLEGGERSLKTIQGLQIEISLIPLYEGEPLIGELGSFLQSRGFTLIFISPEFIDNRTGQQLQVNGLFFRL
jgi:FkbM family methyltransferase